MNQNPPQISVGMIAALREEPYETARRHAHAGLYGQVALPPGRKKPMLCQTAELERRGQLPANWPERLATILTESAMRRLGRSRAVLEALQSDDPVS